MQEEEEKARRLNCIALFVEENVLALLQIQHSLFLFCDRSDLPADGDFSWRRCMVKCPMKVLCWLTRTGGKGVASLLATGHTDQAKQKV